MKYLTLEVQEVFICGMIGVLVQMFLKARELQVLARRSNIQFSFKGYFLEDWISHIASTLVTVLYVVIIRRRIAIVPDSLYEILLVLSATVGAGGAALASKIFSSVERRLLAAVDYKTTVADTATGNLGAPTPAAPMEINRTGT